MLIGSNRGAYAAPLLASIRIRRFMNAAPATCPFLFNYGAALDDGSLYVAGVARELEDRDVPSTSAMTAC
ncbi:hypothetical protein D7Y11_15510 [Corallococcus sp. AB018]|nr:hypothetical protein D7V77_35070 [Corallococcus sp. CA041A]RUO92289.1 hypothetical protein D7Y11_15510 [Corallococcus sp. AB018]